MDKPPASLTVNLFAGPEVVKVSPAPPITSPSADLMLTGSINIALAVISPTLRSPPSDTLIDPISVVVPCIVTSPVDVIPENFTGLSCIAGLKFLLFP